MTKDQKKVASLRQAAQLIERGWTRERAAENKNGVAVGPCSPTACAWCLTGAVMRTSVDIGVNTTWVLDDVYYEGLRRYKKDWWAVGEGGPMARHSSLEHFNDTHALCADEVRDLLNNAADRLEKGAS